MDWFLHDNDLRHEKFNDIEQYEESHDYEVDIRKQDGPKFWKVSW